ncbi:hypothetical protein [Pseudomonas koreensis]|uniref:hypothetical protein n=1 Tax=Pseudomonas koreensis TaxID=198620 RepID=UPI003208DF33
MTQRDVKKIWDLLEDAGLEVEATLECADGISRKTKSITEIFDYDNLPRAEIKTLRLSGFSSEVRSFSTISLGSDRSTKVTCSLNGHVDKVAEMRIKLMDIVDGMKPWYDLLARVDFSLLALGFFMFWGLFFSFLGSGKSKAEIAPIQAFYSTSIAIGAFAAIALAGWVMTRLRSKYFPIAVFEIGHGLKRHEFAEKVRWGVVVAFVVGLAGAFAFKPFA